jgi:methylated-DNA-[protein]-cysteine S-methyltransferase
MKGVPFSSGKPANPVLSGKEFPTQFGLVRLLWTESASGPKVERIILPGDTRAERGGFPPAVSAKLVEDASISSLVADIRSFLSGKDVVFGTEILDLDQCRPFQRRVLLAEHGIPRGMVSTYGRIARHLGIPGSARAVGNALARNPFPLVIPCHRALRSDGDPGGFQGGRDMKIRLLAMEGSKFRPDGKVLMEHVWY